MSYYKDSASAREGVAAVSAYVQSCIVDNALSVPDGDTGRTAHFLQYSAPGNCYLSRVFVKLGCVLNDAHGHTRIGRNSYTGYTPSEFYNYTNSAITFGLSKFNVWCGNQWG